jgi:hypothetical protein
MAFTYTLLPSARVRIKKYAVHFVLFIEVGNNTRRGFELPLPLKN